MNRLIKKGECLEWEGSVDGCNYGTLSFYGELFKTHRLSYMFHFGEIPKGFYICHHCDNPRCCNPEHLFLGTSKDNSDDKYKKHRENIIKGEEHPNAKLNREKVVEIRKMFISGLYTKKSLSQIFGVYPKAISDILKNRTWKHV
jgi:hypothetical protein